MLRILALILLPFTMLANPYPILGVDGYFFQSKEYEQNSVRVIVTKYNSVTELRESARKLGITEPNVVAFSSISGDRKLCSIHIVDPEISYKPEFVGHEFLHCIYGNFHRYVK